MRTWGPDSVHPQHELSAPVTGRICVNIYIYYGADPEVWGRWLPYGGWMTLEIVMNHAATSCRQGASHLQRPQRCCRQLNQNSLIVRSFSPERDFCWLSKDVLLNDCCRQMCLHLSLIEHRCKSSKAGLVCFSLAKWSRHQVQHMGSKCMTSETLPLMRHTCHCHHTQAPKSPAS